MRSAKDHMARMAQIDEIPQALYSSVADTVSIHALAVAFLYFTPIFQMVAVMTAFFLLMMQNPGSQRQRMVSALLKEFLRWTPLAPLSLPTSSPRDTRGYICWISHPIFRGYSG